MTGNWDRWSGGNVGKDPRTGALLFIDNDGAFFEPLPAKPFEPERSLFTKMRRFPRAFVTALRTLDDAAFEAALGRDESGGELLVAARVRAAQARRREALAAIDALARREGDAIFAFP